MTTISCFSRDSRQAISKPTSPAPITMIFKRDLLRILIEHKFSPLPLRLLCNIGDEAPSAILIA